MVLEPALCPDCGSDDIVRHGRSSAGKPRYKCRNPDCQRSTFIHSYTYRGYLPEVKHQITEMDSMAVGYVILHEYSTSAPLP